MAGDQNVKLKVGIEVDQAQLAKTVKSLQDMQDKMKFSPIAAQAAGGRDYASIDKNRRQAEDEIKRLNLQKQTYAGILELVKQIGREQEKNNRQEHIANIQKSTFNQIQRNQGWGSSDWTNKGISSPSGGPLALGRGGRGTGPGGYGQLDIGSGDFQGILKKLGIGMSIAAATRIAAQGYNTYVAQPANTNLAAGSTAKSTVGYLNDQMLSGDVIGQTLLQNQMATGRGLATEKYDKSIGTIASRIYSSAADLALSATNEIWGTNLDTTRFRSGFETKRASEIGKNTLEQAQAGLAQNNSLQLAQGFFGQNLSRNLGAERSLGLGSNDFQRLQIQMNNRGFLSDQVVGLLNQVQSAGGAASGAQGGNVANLGLEMQRAFNLTNAGGILGKLTGVYGSQGASGFGKVDDASRRILEEAITKGFDRSENTEILRKFTETSAGLLYQSGATKGSDVDRLERDFSQLLSGNPTMKQYEAAQQAFGEYQDMSRQTSGRGGTLGFAAMSLNKNLSKLMPMTIGNFMGMPETALTSTNSDVIAAAVQQGISPDKMAAALRDAKRNSNQATVGLSDKILDPLRKYLGDNDLSSIRGTDALTNLQKTNPAAYAAYQALKTRAHLMGDYVNDEVENEREQMLLRGPAVAGKAGKMDRAGPRLATGTAGKDEETLIAAQAAQEKQLVLNLAALRDQLLPTNESIGALTQKIIQLGNAAHMLSPGEYGNLPPVNTTVNTKNSLGSKPSNGSKPHTGASGNW